MNADAAAVAAALPEYEVGEELGRGGFGIVRAGMHRRLGRAVAIKQLPAFLAADATVRARFAAEARVLAGLAHPHIVPIYDYVERDGICVLVMEQLPGGTVWGRFVASGFTAPAAVAVAMVTCDGLHYAHQGGVLHRDIKPENLLFSAEGAIKVTDFGIARVVGGAQTLATQAGQILGTPAYMAPEQAGGAEVGPQADVFATGVMLYELLAGALPYSEAGGALAVVYRHVYEDAVPLREVAPDVAEVLADVTMKALARYPEDRFPTAEAFGVALGEAGTSLWGPGWMERTDVSFRSPGPILATAARPSAPVLAAGGPAPGGIGTDEVAARIVRPGGELVPVRPAPRSEIDFDELVPVGEVIDEPPSPAPLALAAVLALFVAVLVGSVGIGAPDRGGDLAVGAATVGGADPADGHAVSLDLAEPIEVRLSRRPPGALAATEVQLGFSVAGIPLVDSDVQSLSGGPGAAGASLDAGANRFLAPGKVTAELRLLAGGAVVGRHRFAVDPAQPALLTVPGGTAVVLALFVLAYAESFLKPLRRGRHRRSAYVGMAGVGAAAGLVAVLVGWLLGAPEPAAVTVVSCLAGALAGLAAAAAAARSGRRRRPSAAAQGQDGPDGAAASGRRR
ncbi:MAG: serine/threonine-protein kinase [Acidimicrobiia bacterium]